MRFASAVVLASLLLAPRPAAAQADDALQKKIDGAIDKGVEWLKKKQIRQGEHKGSWGDGVNTVYGGGDAKSSGGMYLASTSLALLALLKCGVDPEDPVVKDGLAYVDGLLVKEYGEVKKGRPSPTIQGSTYVGGILLMMFEALYDARTDEAMKAGGKDPKTDVRPPVVLEAKDKATVTRIVEWLKDTHSRKGGWRYGAPIWESPGGVEEDPSATQIVLLGLASAGRIGVETPPEVWKAAAAWNLEAQEKTGPAVKKPAPAEAGGGTYAVREGDRARGWPYLRRGSKDDERVTGSITACGVSSLILCKAALSKTKLWTKALSAQVDRGIYDGLAWIDLHYTVDGNPESYRSHFYYLYGLERLGTLGSFEKIGAHAWYPDGAKVILGLQAADGHWDTRTEIEPCDVIDTSLALLFLRRATIPVGVTLTR